MMIVQYSLCIITVINVSGVNLKNSSTKTLGMNLDLNIFVRNVRNLTEINASNKYGDYLTMTELDKLERLVEALKKTAEIMNKAMMGMNDSEKKEFIHKYYGYLSNDDFSKQLVQLSSKRANVTVIDGGRKDNDQQTQNNGE